MSPHIYYNGQHSELTTPNTRECAEEQELLVMAGRDANSMTALKYSLVICYETNHINQTWWHMHLIPAHRRLRQEDHKFEVNPDSKPAEAT
jgi:hypothetical protein